RPDSPYPLRPEGERGRLLHRGEALRDPGPRRRRPGAGRPAGPLPRHRRGGPVHGAPARRVFLVELREPVEQDGSALVDRLDAELGDQNEEYQTKRKSLRYGAPIIRIVRSGEFDRYRRRMVESGQRADGQFKVLRLTSDTSFAAEFTAERDLIGSAPAQRAHTVPA